LFSTRMYLLLFLESSIFVFDQNVFIIVFAYSCQCLKQRHQP